MDIREITPRYHVSPQIDPSDAQALADAGYRMVICNRPDAEIPEPLQADRMRAAVEAAGMAFAAIPLTHQSMTPDKVAKQKGLFDSADGPVLAYCASGTRSTVVWALSQVGSRSVDDVLRTASQAGYQLEGLRPTLESLVKGK